MLASLLSPCGQDQEEFGMGLTQFHLCRHHAAIKKTKKQFVLELLLFHTNHYPLFDSHYLFILCGKTTPGKAGKKKKKNKKERKKKEKKEEEKKKTEKKIIIILFFLNGGMVMAMRGRVRKSTEFRQAAMCVTLLEVSMAAECRKNTSRHTAPAGCYLP